MFLSQQIKSLRDLKFNIVFPSTTEGPYLISSEVGKEPVFWMVNEKNHQLTTTKGADKATLFYIILAKDTTNPSDFHIAYWPEKADFG